MANGRQWNVSYPRRFAAVTLGAIAVFAMCAGLGMFNWAVVALGVALLILAVSLVVVAVVRGNARNFVRGTAHVVDVTEPPASVSIGRCELQVLVEAPGLAPAKIKVRDTRVPVGKWPDIGATLPIRVAIDDPRHVRILWDEVRSHGEVAADEERFNEYVQHIIDAELGSDDELNGDAVTDTRPVSPAGGWAAAAEPAAEPTPEPPEEEPPAPRRPSPRRRRPPDAPTGSTTGGTAAASGPATGPSGQTGGFGGSSDPMSGAASAAAVALAEPDSAAPPYHAEPDREHQPGTDLAVPGERLPALPDPSAPTTTGIPPAAPPIQAEEDVLVIDIAPIEGASAVLGVRPTPAGPAAPPSGMPQTPTPSTSEERDSGDVAVHDLLAAHPSARSGPTSAIHGVGVTLIVTDLDRSIGFYRDMLGFSVVDSGLTSAVLTSGDMRVMLRRVSDMAPVDRRLVHLNLEVDDLPAVYEELRSKGIKFLHRPRPAARGEHMELWAAAFRDPDGHGISIIQWRPRTI